MEKRGTESAPSRRRPKQARSIEKVERILGAARALISQVSFEQFTTDLVAQNAGVAVGTIYQYFPNKIEILRALIDQYLGETRKDLLDFDKNVKSDDIELTLNQLHNVVFSNWKNNNEEIHFSLAISKYCKNYPELEQIDREHGKIVAEILMRVLQKLGSKASDEKLFMAGRYLYSMYNMLEQMMIDGGDPELLIDNHSELTRRIIRMIVNDYGN